MRVKTKIVVTIEMDLSDYDMLLDTLGEATKVKSRLYPTLNKKAKDLYLDLYTMGRETLNAKDE